MYRILPAVPVRAMVAALGCALMIGCGGSGKAGPGSDGGGGAATGADGGNPPGSKRIFVTATAYSGNLAGSAGADTICAAAAEAVSLGGRWSSWISTATSDAFSRVQDVGPWFLLDGTMAFANKANFRTMPLVAINITERGTTPSGRVWTGTVSGAIHSEQDCQGFSTADTSVQGTVGASPSVQNWTDNASPASCQSTGSIYCIEQ